MKSPAKNIDPLHKVEPNQIDKRNSTQIVLSVTFLPLAGTSILVQNAALPFSTSGRTISVWGPCTFYLAQDDSCKCAWCCTSPWVSVILRPYNFCNVWVFHTGPVLLLGRMKPKTQLTDGGQEWHCPGLMNSLFSSLGGQNRIWHPSYPMHNLLPQVWWWTLAAK